ncbi:hypothetical protein LOZ58_003316 [Ophidiomyces ophidiicola]|nr:hypothetical protein LOZ58_003316 [Ophidiomyces ophidiicola]
MPITRVTLFKIPEEENRQKVLSFYKTMPQDALKDGKPYIRSVRAGHTFEDQRRQGYTLAVVSQYDTVEDMNYYDNECQAHVNLKSTAKDLHQGVMVVYFESVTGDVVWRSSLLLAFTACYLMWGEDPQDAGDSSDIEGFEGGRVGLLEAIFDEGATAATFEPIRLENTAVLGTKEDEWLFVDTESPEESGFQITSNMGNSFVQLLTRSAVLIALGVAGGGAAGCTNDAVVENRRSAEGGGGIEFDGVRE